MVGQKIDYAVLIDFSVFKDLVNLVDGVDVDVERTFTDKLYPLPVKKKIYAMGIKNLNADMKK